MDGRGLQQLIERFCLEEHQPSRWRPRRPLLGPLVELRGHILNGRLAAVELVQARSLIEHPVAGRWAGELAEAFLVALAGPPMPEPRWWSQAGLERSRPGLDMRVSGIDPLAIQLCRSGLRICPDCGTVGGRSRCPACASGRRWWKLW